MAGIIVIGAGQAGASLTARLRQEGYTGPVTLIGEEPVPPYQRPPLSKGYLMGTVPLERLFLRKAEVYAEQGIDLRLGTPVTAIDTAARTVTLGDEVLAYEELALTTGAVPRRLPDELGGNLEGVHIGRTLANIDGIGRALKPGARVLIVGGGYIGLEGAALGVKLGLDVTVVEMAERILCRVAAAETADVIRSLHQGQGVRVLEGVGLRRLTGEGHVTGAVLTDGTELALDLVIAGVGVVPATELAEAAGIAVENGIRTDARGRTSAPHVWAAGDCASFPMGERRLRLECVQNAIDQAELVADNMLGAARDYAPVPWFWSDQYDTKLQIAGLHTGHDRVVTRPGPGEARSFWYFCGKRFVAVDALNDGRAYMVGKRLLEMGRSPDPAVLADPEADLKPLLR